METLCERFHLGKNWLSCKLLHYMKGNGHTVKKSNKKEMALHLSEEIINGIELEKLSSTSILHKCMRLSRLMDDFWAMEWLGYESAGYPFNDQGFIANNAFQMGWQMGRGYYDNSKAFIFIELVSELEAEIEALKLIIGNVTTQGLSVSGNQSANAVNALSWSATQNNINIKQRIAQCKRRLQSLNGMYYQYALKVNIELSFSGGANRIFESYREKVDIHLINLVPESIRKLQAVYEAIDSDNEETWSQALTSCRRLFESVSNKLFDSCFPEYNTKKYTTKSGKELVVTGDSYLNRIFAVIDHIDVKSPNKTLAGSYILYSVDWVSNLHTTLCKGVHSEVTYEEAMRAILHTYMCLGDVCNYHYLIIDEGKQNEVDVPVQSIT